MIIILAVFSVIGWLCGVWLPWWGIGIVLALLCFNGHKGAYDGGLEAIPLVIGTIAFVFFMLTVGFYTGDTTISDIGNAIKFAFTGS